MEINDIQIQESDTFNDPKNPINKFDILSNNHTAIKNEENENSSETKEITPIIKNSTKINLIQQVQHPIKLTSDQGRLGLKNLGNTCYMNSALQCLGHTKELMNYILTGDFKKDFVKHDEIDSDSELLYYFTNHFCDFISELWSDNREAINPVNLRSTLIKIYPQFDNNFQQDAHEVLTLILDSLHQQLNRVPNELDMITADLNLFSQMSQRENSLSLSKHQSQYFWNSHKNLNDSIITDLFFGQLISTIKCLNCFETYNTYEPFSSLGLSIPNEYKILIYFIPMKKNNKAIKLFLKINDNMQFKNLIDKVRESTDYKFNNGTFYWVLNNKFLKLVDPDERCGDLLNRLSFLFLIETDYEMDENFINNTISHDNHDLVNSQQNNFYVCLNFNMFELQSDSIKKKETKVGSYPRIFKYHNSLILEKKELQDTVFFDEKKIIMKIFDPIINYIKNFIQAGEDIKELIDNELIFFTVKSVNILRYNIDSNKSEDNIFSLNKQVKDKHIDNTKDDSYCPTNFLCLFCGKENSSEFLCDCINKWLFNSILNFELINISFANLTYFLNNNQFLSQDVIEMNVNISIDILKYRELNRCKDYTQKYIHDNGINFYNLLDYFTGDEKLTLSDNYFCNTCKKNVIAFKKMQINKFPQILVVNLKRFRYENNFGKNRISRRNDNVMMSNNFSGEKKENMIDFPINNLDLTKYNKNNIPVFYELFAICNHHGKISSGHYTAICKHPTTYKWIEYDDRIVKNYSETNLITPNAYLLFYRKKLNS